MRVETRVRLFGLGLGFRLGLRLELRLRLGLRLRQAPRAWARGLKLGLGLRLGLLHDSELGSVLVFEFRLGLHSVLARARA